MTEYQGRIHLRLRVAAKASAPRIAGEHAGSLKLSVAEPPEKGRANQGVVRLLADALGIPRKQIELVSGHASQDKRVAIAGLNMQTLRERLER